jgi:hypothetical protein
MIVCIETGKEYKSIKDVSLDYGINEKMIRDHLYNPNKVSSIGKKKYPKSHIFYDNHLKGSPEKELKIKKTRLKKGYPKSRPYLVKSCKCKVCGTKDETLFSSRSKAVCRKCHREERLKDPKNLLLDNLRSRQRSVIKGKVSTTKGLGCDSQFLRSYIESLWEPWMNWDNYGIGEGEWSVDHILPLSSFEMDGEGNWDPNSEYNKKLIHYTNLRPLLHKENMEKSNKLLDIYYYAST